MTTIILLVAAVIVGTGVVIRFVGSRSSGATSQDLGTLSHTWLAEQRLGRKSDLN